MKTPTILFMVKMIQSFPIASSSKLSELENVEYVVVQNSKHELLNQDTRPFVLSELHRWLKNNNII